MENKIPDDVVVFRNRHAIHIAINDGVEKLLQSIVEGSLTQLIAEGTVPPNYTPQYILDNLSETEMKDFEKGLLEVISRACKVYADSGKICFLDNLYPRSQAQP